MVMSFRKELVIMKRKRVGYNRYAKYGYIFSMPFMIAFLIFSFYPTVYTALIGFTDLKGIGNTEFHFLVEDPFLNFKLILSNPSFITSFKNTVFLWICNFIPQMVLALLLAVWFTDKRMKIKGQGIFKILLYMPNIITAATIAILFNALFGYPMGPVNDILVRLGIIESPIPLLMNKNIARYIVIFIQSWMWYGATMIILISGILGINPEIYESAEVDGANKIQKFYQITLPNIRTILTFTLITSLIGGLNMFDIPKLFQNGGPDNSTLTTSLFIYNQAFSGSYMYNRAAAASMIMFIIIAILSAITFYFMRDKDEILERKKLKEMKRGRENGKR